MAVTSSLNSIHITPRTPISSRVIGIDGEEEDVELSLLGEDERRQAAFGAEGEGIDKRPISLKDKKAMALLCVLCEQYSHSSRVAC